MSKLKKKTEKYTSKRIKHYISKYQTEVECIKYILLPSPFSEKILNLTSMQCKVIALQKLNKELHMKRIQKANVH